MVYFDGYRVYTFLVFIPGFPGDAEGLGKTAVRRGRVPLLHGPRPADARLPPPLRTAP